MAKLNMKARQRARKLAMQAMYEWQISGNAIAAIEQHALASLGEKKIDTEYFQEIMLQLPPCISELDTCFEPFLDRKLIDVTSIELAILRLGVFELLKRPDVPYRVVINEAIELAKQFGAQDSHKYINGVLDKVSQQNRRHEMTAQPSTGITEKHA